MHRMIFASHLRSFTARLVIWIFVASFIAGGLTANAQSPTPTTVGKRLHAAIGQLESSSAADWDKCESVLKLAMQDARFRESATCALAVFYVKRGNLEAVSNFLRKAGNLFPSPTVEQQSLLLRIQLSNDLVRASENGTERFSNLVRSTLNDKLALDQRLASAAMLGTVVGMLEPDLARSPIDQKVLTDAKDAFLKSSNTELGITFDANYRKAKSHATALSDWLVAHLEKSLDEKMGIAAASEEELRDATKDRGKSADTIGQETKDHRKNIYQLSKKKESIQREINAVLFQWNCHPEFHNPIKPNRNSIRVEKTEEVEVGPEKERKVKKIRYNEKGEKETYEVTEKFRKTETRDRSDADINRDIDRIYLPLLNRYNTLKNAGQALIDQRANGELQFRDAEAEILASKRALVVLEEKSKDEQAYLRRLRVEAKISREAVSAVKTGLPETAFRPPYFELFDYAMEARAIQNHVNKTLSPES